MTPACGNAARTATIIGALLLGGCGASTPPKPPPLPRLEGMEADVTEKIRRLHAAIAANPTKEAWAVYARTLNAHDLPEATDAYLVAAAHTPMPAKFELVYLAGFSCAKADPERAIALLEEANGLKGDYAPLHLRLGAIYEVVQRLPDAKRHFARAHEIKPSSVALVGMGRVALAEGRIDEAIRHLEKARDLSPDHPEAHAALASAYTRAGRPQDARRASALVGDIEREYPFEDPIVTTMAREGVSSTSLEQFGIAALRAYQFDQALAAFDRALVLQPESAGLLLNRAQALVGLRRFAEAEPVLDRVLAKRPKDAAALAFRAGCLMTRSDLAGAVAELRKAIAADPALVDAHWNLARALRALNQNREARQELEIVLERRPRKTDARVLLASILADEGSVSEAMTHVEQILAQEPSNSPALEIRRRLTGR